ncbi:hypothetical protein CB0940_02445 [Cercospora beticola]|uniref:Uncharacterized protein n=1 Tax=Cercospora beticola TaxID=122368 RepID=A0A2G5I245_CERBT|nr:hypothetical protein CB0940_02445 [Cercospora beticola]PIA98874.1 hypothetical protein CB0940_02445 [Cercospora beticola]WPA99579.1 hypothetical protein RHO25_004197 [Cercospora beticola]
MHVSVLSIAAVLLSSIAELGTALPQIPNNPAASVLAEAVATWNNEPTTPTINVNGINDLISAVTAIIPSPTPPPPPPKPPGPLCRYILTGINSYGGGGGGGAYQSHINIWDFNFSIEDSKSGKKRYTKILSGDLKPYAFSVGRADYKGTHNMCVSADFWRGSYKWNSCRISFDGGEYIEGKREKVDIDSNIVSVVKSRCVVEYEC